MSIVYKINILAALKERGYNTKKLRNERILSESAAQSLRENKPISFSSLDRICQLLELQPGDIIEFVADDRETP